MYFLQILNHSCVEYVNAFMFMRKKKCNALLGFFFFFIIVPHFVSYEIDLFVCLVFTTVIIHQSRDTEGAAVLELKTATSIIILSLVSFCGAIYDK